MFLLGTFNDVVKTCILPTILCQIDRGRFMGLPETSGRILCRIWHSAGCDVCIFHSVASISDMAWDLNPVLRFVCRIFRAGNAFYVFKG